MEKIRTKLAMNKLTLQIIAMVTMLIDHIGAVLLPDVFFLRRIGRLAFPIFAYFIAEGFARTHSFKRYLLRMAAFAVLAELPFDLAFHGHIPSLHYQNTLWTFCLALLCLRWLDKLRQRHEGTLLWALDMVLVCLTGFAAGELLHTDYGGFGVLLVIGFYVCRMIPNAYRYGGELLFVAIFAVIGFGGIESFALLSVPLLWLYNGKSGKQSRAIQYACYAFYPAHLLILGLIARYLR